MACIRIPLENSFLDCITSLLCLLPNDLVSDHTGRINTLILVEITLCVHLLLSGHCSNGELDIIKHVFQFDTMIQITIISKICNNCPCIGHTYCQEFNFGNRSHECICCQQSHQFEFHHQFSCTSRSGFCRLTGLAWNMSAH